MGKKERMNKWKDMEIGKGEAEVKGDRREESGTCISLMALCCRFRYTMEELERMMLGIQKRAEEYQTWADRVERALDGLESEKAGR